ncbi:SusC/RagA family TonB-linked outer membrane protein [Marinilabilia rubra]|uniref:SusC/RagA family TonB-linked outer membrane protein n=1 Tax=Marinilabilia rubra TaxID=2162893 RepID=A0A2U2B757_9BACT|nr:TonB-dependent receptor [Marinilabilia rubra]PWD98911.1 SusC/RagA family TonB-linked outer membrane protein [Marinilabilia rubra]
MRKNLKRISLMVSLLFLFGLSLIHAQEMQITGQVTDTEGEPLPGVTVVKKGTTTGTITDIDGNYSINANKGDDLVFSFIGMEKREVRVADQRILNVELRSTMQDLEEVTVVAYGQQKKVSITGAITSVQSEELMKSPNASVANSLAGKVTGLSTIQFSGQPGADDPSIYVRGVASLSEERSEPLMIVDGVERSFMDLDPDEIESISVLKDASATAVYGVRGANGVIIVTTKRGEKGEAKISTSFSTGIQQPTRLLDFADSYTYAQRYNEAELNDDPTLTPDQLRFSPEAVEAFRTGSNPIIYPDTDWVDYILKPSAMQYKGNVSISGGSDKVKYFVSLGILNQDGLFETFDSQYDYNFSHQRYNYRSNLDINVTSSTKVGVTVGGRVGITNQPNAKDGMDQLFRLIYWSVPFSGPGIVDDKYILNSDYYIADNKKDGLDPFYGRGYSNILNNTLNFDIDLEQKLDFVLQGLKFRTKISYNTNYRHAKVRNSSVAHYEPYFRKDLDPEADPDDGTIVYRKIGSDGNLGYNENYGKGRNWYFEAGLNYNRKFGLHNVGALVLYNQNKVYYPRALNGGPAENQEIPAGLVGLVGRVTYDYKTKYMADFNLGYNGSENFAEDQRFGVFPAVSVGWIPTEEPFMQGLSFINYMKIRASYGLVGNDKIGGDRFLYLPNSYEPSSGGYNFGTNNPSNQTAAAEGRIGNPGVTWETAVKQNLGIDFKFIQGKLGASLDLFKENREDILTYRGTVPGFVAYDLPAVNIGEVENQGYEAEVKWNDRRSSDFRYWLNLNVSHARNEIIFMDEVPQNEDYLYRTGHPVNQPFGYVFDRFASEADAEDGADIPDHQYNLQPGDMIYKDLNDDGVIDQDDQKAIGFPNYPEFTFGANLGFEFKNFDFSMSWAGASNTSRMLGETYRIAFGNTLNRSLLQYMADERWTPETAESATYPRMTLTGSNNNSKDSDFWLKDASYVRLKNMEVGYNFSGSFLRRFGISKLRAYMNGYNLLTFDNLEITDPESRTGSDSKYPLTKIYNLGIKVNF